VTPFRVDGAGDFAGLLRLVQSAFAEMDGRIDPPSSSHDLTVEAISGHVHKGEIWAICPEKPIACVFLTPKPGRLYIGKLAVDLEHRGQGLGRMLMDTAEARARALGLPALTLGVRIELTETHRFYTKLGFKLVEETAHPGYDRPTSLNMRKDLR
jgi:ribosomal protein S18 acetylase RimI-like enzyme